MTADSLNYFDALAALRGASKDRDQLYLFPFDAHASALGYRVVAQSLAQYLLGGSLRESVCTSR